MRARPPGSGPLALIALALPARGSPDNRGDDQQHSADDQRRRAVVHQQLRISEESVLVAGRPLVVGDGLDQADDQHRHGNDAEDHRETLHASSPSVPPDLAAWPASAGSASAGSANGSAVAAAALPLPMPSDGTTATATRRASTALIAASIPLNRPLLQVSFHICSQV